MIVATTRRADALRISSRLAALLATSYLLAGCAITQEREPWHGAPTAAPTPDPASVTPGTPGDISDRVLPIEPVDSAAVAANSDSGDPSAAIVGTDRARQLAGLTPEQYPDLFDRIRAGFQLPVIENRQVDTQLLWYARNPEYLERVFGRAELYLHYIVTEVERRGMPLELALLPVIESAFEPFAYSSASASGLWQFIPGTGTRFGLPRNWWYDGRRDVLESTRAALDYLQYMHDEFDGDWLLAIAGYNCGEGCVAREIRQNRAAGRPTDFWSLHLPAETRAYVPKLLAMARLVAEPESYGLAFSPIPNEPYFARVETGSQIDLRLAAELAGLTVEQLYELNPAYHRWATSPNGPHHLLVPIGSADPLREALALLTADEKMRAIRHTVQSGETLASIAARYGTQPHVVRELNDLGTGPISAGRELLVPSATMELPAKVLRAAARVDRGSGTQTGRTGRRPVIHVVRRGESLWAIARRNNTDVRTLMRLNGLQPGQTLRTGERIVVSQRAARGGTSGARAGSSSATAGSTRTVRHTVRRGDTLSAIARLYRVTVSDIAGWNGISRNATLRPGQTLTVRVARR